MDKKEIIENFLDNRSFKIPVEDLDIARHEIGLMLNNLDNQISVQRKEINQLLRWLINLNQKIMKIDKYKGLRGYPLTLFNDKYRPLPPKDK